MQGGCRRLEGKAVAFLVRDRRASCHRGEDLPRQVGRTSESKAKARPVPCIGLLPCDGRFSPQTSDDPTRPAMVSDR